MNIQQLEPEHRPLAARIVGEWGYPRPILDREQQGHWFAIGPEHAAPDGIVWMTELPRIFALHACRNPETGLELGSREAMQALACHARRLGAARLYAMFPPGARDGLPAEAVERYLRMRGWSQDEHGAYIDLGD